MKFGNEDNSECVYRLDTPLNQIHGFAMYYLWLNEAQAGPFTLQQVQSMWNGGQITALTLYWQEGNAEWQPLGNVLSEIEPKKAAFVQAQTTVLPPFEQTIARKTGSLTGASAAPQQAASAQNPSEQVHWTGHPTLWKWAGLLFLALVLMAASGGLFVFAPFPKLPIIADAAPLSIAVLIFAWIFIKRNTIRYTVTSKRVGVETGIFTKTSRELRIQDIRSIAAKTNFLGYGDIEFSTAARDDADVIFIAVAGANSVRDMVKQLQT